MPELPEVETVRRGMEKALNGKRVEKIIQNRPDLRFPIPDGLPHKLKGKILSHINRRGKYLLMHWRSPPQSPSQSTDQAKGPAKGPAKGNVKTDQVMILHLGMSGRLLISAPDQPQSADDFAQNKHDHLIFQMSHDTGFCFRDPRRFGFVDLCDPDKIDENKHFKTMGPEPLGNHMSGPALYHMLKNRKTPIKSALLDQKIIAGLGNIYVCEALFYAGIRPTRICNTLKKAECERLAVSIPQVLNAAIDAGGSSLRDYVQSNGELGYFQFNFAVYGREGENCHHSKACSETERENSPCVKDCNGIKRIIQSGRSSFYCPGKQA